MRTLDDMLGSLASAIVADEARHENAWGTLLKASEVARRLPLVHRTYKPGSEVPWRELLEARRFVAGPPCTGDRERTAGIPRAAYFFLGCGAYPDGLVGFVLDAATVVGRPASFTPFDSGSIEKYAVPADPMRRPDWNDAAKGRFLTEHTGHGGDVAAFAGPFLAAHFRDPMTYVRLGQTSVPEFQAYHGLESTSGDRRAWTVEVQAHEDVPFGVGDATVKEIIVARSALLEDLPEDLKRLARVADPEDEVLESLARRIEAEAA